MSNTINKVTLAGKIAEIESRTGLTSKGVPYLAGTVTVETSQDNLIPVGFFVTEKKKDGSPNQIYQSLSTVVSEYKTIAEHTRENADSVEITGANLDENFFFSNGRMIRGFNVRSSFYNRKASVEPKNEFIVSGQIIGLVDEIKDDVPTGALIVRLLSLGYENRASVLDFKVVNPQGVSYIKDTCSVGQEIKLNGEIIVHEEIIEKKEEAAFGDPIITTSRRVERSLIVSSATPPIDSTYPKDVVETSLAERERLINEAKERAEKASKPAAQASSPKNFTL